MTESGTLIPPVARKALKPSVNKILISVINHMSDAQESISGGIDKKTYVMSRLKDFMDKEDYDRYEPMIGLIIDFIKYLSTHKELLNSLKRKNCFSCI